MSAINTFETANIKMNSDIILDSNFLDPRAEYEKQQNYRKNLADEKPQGFDEKPENTDYYDNLHGFDWFFYHIWSNPNKRRSFIKSIIFWAVVLGGLIALLFWPSTTHPGTVEPNLNNRFWKLFSQNSETDNFKNNHLINQKTSYQKSNNLRSFSYNFQKLNYQTIGSKIIKNQVNETKYFSKLDFYKSISNTSNANTLSLVSSPLLSISKLKSDLTSLFSETKSFVLNGSEVVLNLFSLSTNSSFIDSSSLKFAQTGSGSGSGKPIDPCAIGPCPLNFNSSKGDSVGETANNIFIQAAQVLTFVAASVAIFFIVYNGFSMMTANGDSSKYMKAWMGVLYSILGLVVAVAAYSVIAALIGVLGSWNK
jgi:hypothetical protein